MQSTNYSTKKCLIIFLMVLGLPFMLTEEEAVAQTPVTSIENATGDTVFTSFDDGALLGLGEFNTGVIPTEGAGTRMMWYPAKAAFRAGRAGLNSGNEDAWNNNNIGIYSTAFGVDTYATALLSTAWGNSTTASGNHSTAMGFQTTANNFQTTAMGDNTIAASSNSLSIGKYNNNNSTGDNSLFVVGNGSGSSDRSDAFVVKDDGALLALGEEGSGVIPTEGAGTRMMWYPAKAAFRAGLVGGTEWDDTNIGEHSVAFGRYTEASGSRSTAIGNRTTASGASSIAMGFGTIASGDRSTAMGFNTNASGVRSTALGYNTVASTEASLSIGQFNNSNSSADNTLFVVGNGSIYGSSDALVLDSSGDMTISGTLTESSDRRLKTNISPIDDNTLGKLSNITPSAFEFKNKQTHPEGKQIGLIAQEVQNEFPELINKNSKGYLSVSYSKFTAVLLKGIQEQQQKIENQQSTINELKEKTQRIAVLEEQMSEIKESRQMAGMPVSAFGILLLGIVIGGGFWWYSNQESSAQS